MFGSGLTPVIVEIRVIDVAFQNGVKPVEVHIENKEVFHLYLCVSRGALTPKPALVIVYKKIEIKNNTTKSGSQSALKVTSESLMP